MRNYAYGGSVGVAARGVNGAIAGAPRLNEGLRSWFGFLVRLSARPWVEMARSGQAKAKPAHLAADGPC